MVCSLKGLRKVVVSNMDCDVIGTFMGSKSSDGLVGYDAALTRLRSRVQFPVLVLMFSSIGVFLHHTGTSSSVQSK